MSKKLPLAIGVGMDQPAELLGLVAHRFESGPLHTYTQNGLLISSRPLRVLANCR
jgi:hypothetical protein